MTTDRLAISFDPERGKLRITDDFAEAHERVFYFRMFPAGK
jgi:hypothetical protein